eukprot:jgi/Ulvmu1/8283/UM041_0095.1
MCGFAAGHYSGNHGHCTSAVRHSVGMSAYVQVKHSLVYRSLHVLREPSQSSHVLSTRKDALQLYRTILKYSALFDWHDEHGVMWRDKLRASARKEFEAARAETDPEVITRLLITSREAVDQVAQKFIQKREALHGQDKHLS